MVEGRRQLHGNRHLHVTVPCPEPATPPPCGSSSAVAHGTTARVPQKIDATVDLSETPGGGGGWGGVGWGGVEGGGGGASGSRNGVSVQARSYGQALDDEELFIIEG